MRFFSVLNGIKNCPPSPSTFSEPFLVFDRTFLMKLSFHGNGKLERKNKLLLFFVCVFAFSVNEKFIVLLALMSW